MGACSTDSQPVVSNGTTTYITTPTPSHASGPSSSEPIFLFTRLPLTQLDRGEFPNVKLWLQGGYRSRCKSGKNGDVDDLVEKPEGSILSMYMEDENGNEIPEEVRKATRETAKGFFNLIMEKGRAPGAWDEAAIDVKNEYIHIMESSHPFLRLCEGHWKAKKVATNSYSQWHSIAAPRWRAILAKRRADAQVIDVDTDDEVVVVGSSKRPRDEDDDAGPLKRPRSKETQPPPRSHAKPTTVTTRRQRVCRSFYSNYMRY